MRRGPLSPPPPQRRQLVAPADRRFRAFYLRLAERRAAEVYRLTDPWLLARWERERGEHEF